jgi:hypothetical protein
MAITVPQPGNDIDAVLFGQPVANQLNALVPTVWYNLVYSNNWSARTDIGQGAGYRKIGDIVYLRGLIAYGTVNVAAATLPTGFRPPAQLYYPTVVGGGIFGYITINGVGQIVPWVANNGQVSLDFAFSTVA